MAAVAGPGVAVTTPAPTRDPAFTSAGAIMGYIFGTLAVVIILLVVCLVIRKRRWKPAKKYIKRQSERSIGLGPKLNDDQNGAKRGKSGTVSLKHLSNGTTANSNGKIKSPKKTKPLAQTIKMQRLDVRREAKTRKRVVKDARKALKRGEHPPLDDLLGLSGKTSSRPASARSHRTTHRTPRPESAPSHSRTNGGIRKGVSNRNIELPSLDPLRNGGGVPTIEIYDETDSTPRLKRSVEAEVHVHFARAGSSRSNDSDTVSLSSNRKVYTKNSKSDQERPGSASSSSRPGSASSRPGSAASLRPGSAQKSGRLSPTKPQSARSIRSSASSPALMSMDRAKSPIHTIIMDHSDIEEDGEDNYVFNLNTTEL